MEVPATIAHGTPLQIAKGGGEFNKVAAGIEEEEAGGDAETPVVVSAGDA